MARRIARVTSLSVLVVGMIVIFSLSTFAQSDYALQQGFKPYEAYHGGDIDQINVQTGKLVLRAPLISFPQRGNLHLNFIIGASSPTFTVEKDCEPGTPPPPCDYITNAYGGATIIGAGVSPEFGSTIGGNGTVYYSGSHPLGYVYSASDFDGSHPLGDIGGGIFESVDATGIRWDKNANVTTDRSGIRTIISTPSPSSVTVEDPNGNEIIQAAGGGSITDTLGRVIPTVPSGLGPPNGNSSNCPTGPLPVNSAYAWIVPAYAGGSSTYTFCFVQFQLNINLHTGGLSAHNIADQTIVKALQSIVLPNGQSWTFTYDTSSGILTQVKLPTGGSISYSSGIVQGCKESSTTFPWLYMTTVGSRSVDANDGNGAHTWGYSGPVTQTVGTLTTLTRTVSDPAGNQDVYTMTPLGNTCSFYPTQVQKYQGSAAAGTLLETEATAFSFTVNPNDNSLEKSVVNVVPTTITTTWANGQTKTVSRTYDSGFTYNPVPGGTSSGIYGNLMSESATDYGSGGAGPLLSTTFTDYLAFNNSVYKTLNLLSLPSSVKICSPLQAGETGDCGSGNSLKQRSLITYGYDGYTLNSSGITTQHDSAPPTGSMRGNQTSKNHWLNTTGTYLSTIGHYFDTGMVNTVTDPLNNTAIYTYSSTFAGAFQTQTQLPDTNSVHHITSANYDFNTGLLASSTDENSNVTNYVYDNMNRISSVSFPDTGQTTFTYTDIPPLSVTKTTAIYGGSSPINKVDKIIFDGLGRGVQTQLVSDPEGITYVDTTYDGIGRIATVSNPYRDSSHTVYLEGMSYGTTTNAYDALGRVLSITNQDGSSAITSYSGSCTTVTDEAGHSRKSCSDALGRLIQAFEDPGSSPHLNYETDYQYGALDNLLRVDQKGAQPGDSSQWRTRTFAYDSLSRLLCAANPEVTSSTGTPATCPNPDSGTYTAGTTRYSYDANGNLLSKKTPKENQSSGAVTVTSSYSYDALNRLTQKSYDDGTATVKYGYDGVSPTGCTPPTVVSIPTSGIPLTPTNQIGRRSSMCDASGATAWIFDQIGRPSIEQRTLGSVTKGIGYQYYLDGPVWRTWYPGANFVYSKRTAAGREFGVQDNGTSFVTPNAQFYPNGALREFSQGASSTFGGILTERAYNKRLQPMLEYSILGVSPNTPLLKRCYDFHLNGGISASLGGVTCTFSGTTPGDNGNAYQIVNKMDDNRTQNFTYDALNRIQQAYTNGPNWGETYSPNITAPGAIPTVSGIDAWGNLTNRSGVTGKINYEPLGCPANNKNQLTTCSLNYDAAGNMTSNGGATYVYDGENRITSAGGVTYTYDGDGKRVKKSNGTLYWTGVGSNTLSESDLAGTVNADYFYFNGMRVARVDRPSNALHVYINDHLGTARIIATPTGTNTMTTAESDYYPYGGEIPISGSDSNHYKFTGKERDTESTLDYFGARHYASTMGRFMTPDQAADDTIPVSLPWADFKNPQSLNLYSYALNNPVTYVDPDGHDVHVCVDNSSGGQNCFNMGDQQYADLQKQQNGQNGVGMPGGSMPNGNITCGGQVCGSATFFEPGLKDTSLDVAMFIGGVASLGRGLIEGGLGLLRGAGEAGAGTAAREAGAAVAEQVVAKGGKAAIRDALESGAVNELQKQAVKRALARGAAADSFTVEKLADGSIRITREVAGGSGGLSRATYESVVDAGGNSVPGTALQRGYNAAGELDHVDPK